MEKIIFTVEKTDTGFSAFARDYPVYTTGESMKELRANILEAINTWKSYKGMDEVRDSAIEVQLDLPQFFDYYKEINAKSLSKRIGMNESLLSQYINGIKMPSRKQTQRIIEGIRNLGRELSTLEFA